MKLSAIRIFVRELAPARAIYSEMLGLVVKQDGSRFGFCLFEAGGADLLVEAVPIDAPSEEQASVARFTGVSCAVSDIATRINPC